MLSARANQAIIFCRFRMKAPIHIIAKIVGCSTRTVWCKINRRVKRGSDYKKFDKRRSPHKRGFAYVSSKGKIYRVPKLVWRAALYIAGAFSDVLAISEEEPP